MTRQDLDIIHVVIIVFILWLLSVGTGVWVPYNHLLLVVIVLLILLSLVQPRATR